MRMKLHDNSEGFWVHWKGGRTLLFGQWGVTSASHPNSSFLFRHISWIEGVGVGLIALESYCLTIEITDIAYCAYWISIFLYILKTISGAYNTCLTTKHFHCSYMECHVQWMKIKQVYKLPIISGVKYTMLPFYHTCLQLIWSIHIRNFSVLIT